MLPLVLPSPTYFLAALQQSGWWRYHKGGSCNNILIRSRPLKKLWTHRRSPAGMPHVEAVAPQQSRGTHACAFLTCRVRVVGGGQERPTRCLAVALLPLVGRSLHQQPGPKSCGHRLSLGVRNAYRSLCRRRLSYGLCR